MIGQPVSRCLILERVDPGGNKIMKQAFFVKLVGTVGLGFFPQNVEATPEGYEDTAFYRWPVKA